MVRKDKKKLLVFTSTFPRWKNDTIPSFVYELSKRLTKKFEVYVLAPHYPGAKDFEIMDKMKVYRFHYFFKKYETLAGGGGIFPMLKKNKLNCFKVPFFLFGEYFALKKLVKQINPDVIHAHWIIPQGWIASKIKKKFGVPYVVTSHGSDLMGLKGFYSMKDSALKNSKRITVVSNELKKEVLKINPTLNDKIAVIPMGVDPKIFNPKKRELKLKKKHGITGPFLLFVGRLAHEKGIDILIEAMPKVIEGNPQTKLLVVGEGTLGDSIKKRVKELGIEKSIIFTGWIDNKNLPKYYATADVFICPSRREGSPVSYIESLLCGTPLIIADLPVSREIIQGSSFLLGKGDAKELSKKIIDFLSGKISFEKKTFEYLIKKYGWKRVSKSIEINLK
jgi:glycosyltransferase involved in cell wall biosynthesis